MTANLAISTTGIEDITEAQLVQAAIDLVPVLFERAEEAERLGRLPDETIADLDAAGITRLTTPRRYGGCQASAATLLEVTHQLARACVSTSFVADVYASVPFLVSLFPDDAQHDVFSAGGAPKLINTFNPGGGGTRTDGGFILSGRWPFSTGQHHADWAIMSALTNRPDETMDVGFFLVPRSEFECLDDWQVTGMCGTGSDTLRVDETFVPAHRCLLVSDIMASNFKSSLAREDPYYQVPLLAFALAGFAGTATGGAEGLVNAFQQRVPRRGITYTTYTTQAEAPVTHLQISEARMKADQARFHADRIVATAQGLAADLPLELRARCRADAAWAFRLAKEVADIVHSASGASAIHRRDALQRMLRDIQALSVHSLMLATTNAELYGRVLCGIDPETPFV